MAPKERDVPSTQTTPPPLPTMSNSSSRGDVGESTREGCGTCIDGNTIESSTATSVDGWLTETVQPPDADSPGDRSGLTDVVNTGKTIQPFDTDCPGGRSGLTDMINTVSTIVTRSVTEREATTTRNDAHLPIHTGLHAEAMTSLQAHAQEQQARANLTITSLRSRLRRRDVELRYIRERHEQQMAAVVAHLLRLEGQMVSEQKEVLAALSTRDDVIKQQKADIAQLTEANERLRRALEESHVTRDLSESECGDPFQESDSKVVMRGTKGRSSARSVRSTSSGEFKSSSDKPRVSFTTAMLEKLRRHKSSLELYKAETMEPVLEGSLRYFSSQDNLVDEEVSETKGGGQNTPGRTGGVSKRSEVVSGLTKKQRCRSLVDYPFVGGLEEEDEDNDEDDPDYEEEVTGFRSGQKDRGRRGDINGSSESLSSSPPTWKISGRTSGLSSSMSSLASDGDGQRWTRRWSSGSGAIGGIIAGGGIGAGGRYSRLSTSAFPLCSSSSPPMTAWPVSPDIPQTPPTSDSSVMSSTSSTSSGELSKSRSVPHHLPTVSENDVVLTSSTSGYGATGGRERPHSLTTVEMLTRGATLDSTDNKATKITSSSHKNLTREAGRGSGRSGKKNGKSDTTSCVKTGSTPTSEPGATLKSTSDNNSNSQSLAAQPTESNPFKSFKNVFKRRGSKKKRYVALGESPTEHHTETVKQYFKKHDLS